MEIFERTMVVSNDRCDIIFANDCNLKLLNNKKARCNAPGFFSQLVTVNKKLSSIRRSHQQFRK